MEINRKPRTGDVKITENVDFSGLLLSDPVLTGLKQAGFTRPSPIQLKAIPLGRCGLDLVVQAKSGTGKTCVFSVVALESIALDAASTQALVLAPTREIAVQIWEVINSLGSGMSGLRCYTFIGGMPLADDKVKLKKCHIAVGTPGRVKQLIEQQALNTESIRLFILDEADKLMEEGFQETINWIYSSLPQNKQMLALSATFPEVLAQHLTAYMRNPTFVRLNTTDPALLGIRQYYKQVPFHPLPQKAFEAKCQALMCLLSEVVFQQCLVFSNYQLRAQSLSDILNAKGWPATYISGSQDQQDRLIAMAKLKKFKCRILISTDLTSRGIDAENVNLVVNLDIPYDHETYLHRIGRAGRFGTYGAAVSFVALGKETASLSAIEKKANTKISVLPEPVPSDLAKSSGFVNIDDLVTTQPLHQVTADVSSSEPKEDAKNFAEHCTPHQIQEFNGADSSTDCPGITTDTDETIPHLIDCLSENVQIGYAEAESLLDGPLANDATLDVLHQEYTTNGMCQIKADGNSDISTVCFSLPEDTESLKGSKASLQKTQPEDISGDHACVNGKSSGESDVETDKNSKLVKVLGAKIPTENMAQKLPSIELPALGCSDTKRSQHLTYKALMADLKHFRETGQLLHDISTPPSTAENVVLTNESFNQVVEDIAKFLKVLHVDPVRETIPIAQTTTEQTQAMPLIISTDISDNVQSFRLGPTAMSKVLSEDNLKVKVDQGGQTQQNPQIGQAKGIQGRTNSGARPKDRRKFKHSTIKVQPSVNSTSKGKTTREDHLLGLDYMKKLTACLDRNSSDDSETTDDSREESVSGSSCSERKRLFEDGDEEYSTDGDCPQDKNFAPTRHQAETYRNSQWVPVSPDNVANHGAENDDCEQYYSQDPQLTDGIDGYQSHWEYADRGEMEWDFPESHEPQHENSTSYQQFGHMHNSLYPHDLWLQCQTLLGSINAAQATQYAWFCEQQHMYHSSYAQYYADMYLRHHTLPRGTNVPKKNYSHRKYKGDFNG